MPTYSIGELAREFGVTPRTIRFYEDQGLLAPRRVGAGARQRSYSGRDRTRLKLTLRGKRLGLALSEIRDLIDMYDSPADTAAQLTRFLEVLGRHRHSLEQQLSDLHETLAEIRSHEARARQLLDQTAGAGRAPPRRTRSLANQA
ncbi:MAG: MerR family transcriptional regulator [Betaproteobacteria bacterium]